MKDMAAKRVMVEINLTSNDVILGIKGVEHHPFSLYRKIGVPRRAVRPTTRSISFIDLTHEDARAVESDDLSYADLKQIVFPTSRLSSPPGASLWASQDYARLASARESDAAAEKPSSACAGLPQRKREGGAEMETGEALPRLRSRDFDLRVTRKSGPAECGA